MTDKGPHLTLAQFAATGRDVDDIGKVLEDEMLDGEPGRVYVEKLYIQAVDPKRHPNLVNAGAWWLTIGRNEYVTDDLPRLEAMLYEFAIDEEYCQPPQR